ncbi:condensation domain-containing protein [Dactylosporangium sp. NPDC000555]|uniref:condensation domain-containing protein n=1 Tax=Dactylosporangium sp. NPDC000555 TaxID=3154260 RepID=UPI003319CC8C
MTTTALLPAAPVQKQMWVVDRMDPAAAIYNEDIAFWIDGDLRVEVLQRAWSLLTRRHDALRYTFDVHDGDLALHVAPEAEVSFEVVEHAGEQEALAWAAELIQQPYDITARPPVRRLLARVGGRHLLVIGFHHAIIDAGSLALLFEELGEVYAALLAGREPALPPVERTYTDFIAWTARDEQRRRVDEQLPQLVAQLTEGGRPTSAELPTDRPRPPVKSTHGRLTEAHFAAAAVAPLRRFAAAHRATPFHVLLAGMTGLLRRYTGLDDMVFGVGTGGRPEGFEEAIGPFSCFVPVRARTGPGTTFLHLIEQARDTAFGLEEAQYVPFSEVVSRVVARRDPTRSPLVQIVFNAPPLSFRGDVLDGCVLHPARLPRTRSRVDLLVNLEWVGDDVVCSSEFDDALYDEQTVRTFLGQLGVFLEAAMQRPEAPVDELPIGWPVQPPGEPALTDRGAAPPAGATVDCDGEWCGLGDDGFVSALSGAAVVLERTGRPAPVGVEGDLLVNGRAMPGIRARRLPDGRLRWRRPEERQSVRDASATSGSRVERHLVEVCRDLLEHDEVAPDDDFFLAGGHSMLAARLVQRLSEEFGVDIPLLIVFEHPVLAELAGELEAQFPVLDQVLAELEQLPDSELGALDAELPPDEPDDPATVTVLSGHEQPFWLMEQFAPGSSVNTMTLRVRGAGPLDLVALEEALNRVVARHEILRTTYGADEALNACRRVHDDVRLRLAVHRTDAEGARRLTEREATTGFDIGRPPLLRCVVVFIGDERFELLLSFHHLVMDYWGVTRVMLPELSAYYREQVAGVPARLDPAEGYRGAILRDQRRRRSPAGRAELEYWREQLRGMRAVELRADRDPGDAVDFRGAVATAEADAALVRALEAYVSRQRTTPFVVIAAAVAATARRWAGSDDVTFMSPAENRRDEADTRVMGTFVNLVSLRFRFTPDLTWDGLVAQSRQVTLDAYAHQSVPVSDALASIGQQHVIASGQGRYLVLNVFSDRTGLQLEGCRVDGGEIVPHDSASTDLELSVLHTADRLELTLKYRSGRWQPDTARRIVDDVLDALRRLVGDGTARLDEQPCLEGGPLCAQ